MLIKIIYFWELFIQWRSQK